MCGEIGERMKHETRNENKNHKKKGQKLCESPECVRVKVKIILESYFIGHRAYIIYIRRQPCIIM